MSQYRRSTKHQRSRASLIIVIVLAFLLLAAAVVLVYSMPQESPALPTTETAPTQPALDLGFACDAVEAQKLYPFLDGVVKLTANRLACLSIQGEEIFASELNMASPYCVQKDRWLVAADRDGNSYTCINGQGVLYSGSRPGRISGVAINQDGMVALIEDRPDSKGVISVLAPDTGQLLFELFLPESGYVLSVSFDPTGAFFDIALLNTDGATVRPMIKRYSTAGAMIGQRIPDLSEIYPLVVYDQAANPVLCSAQDLAAVSYTSEEILYQQKFTQIQAVAQTDKGLMVLATEQLGGKLWLYPLRKDGQTDTALAIGEQVTDLAGNGPLVAMGSGTRVLVYDAGKRAIIFEQNMAVDVLRVGLGDDRTLTVVTRNGVHRLAIRS